MAKKQTSYQRATSLLKLIKSGNDKLDKIRIEMSKIIADLKSFQLELEFIVKDGDLQSSTTIDYQTKKDSLQESFETFYNAYPYRQGKKAALKAWMVLKPDILLQNKILNAIRIAKSSKQWTKDNSKWIPLPASWLNAGRWDDEYDVKLDPVKPKKNYNENPYENSSK